MGMKAKTRVNRTKDLVRKLSPAGVYPYKFFSKSETGGYVGANSRVRKEIARKIKHMRTRPINTLSKKRDQALALKLRRAK